MNDEYRTVSKPMVTRAVIQRSVFLAHVQEVDSEEEARAFVASVREQHKQAAHNCYAYRMGITGEETFYIDDDGEPHGTAGKPIYGAILNRDVTNVVLVVTRYFGGKKLGVRGLIEAYGGAARDVIDHAGVVTRILMEEIKLRCNYSQLNEVLYRVNRWSAELTESHYTEEVQLSLRVRRRDAGQFREALQGILGP
ncbi:hypothetical protein SY88_04400 [Clostridiales bacterium PH28_bin88]|nr:hypothetical protein SY88_04400 [Clostridiales bacterium PH28_bin88]